MQNTEILNHLGYKVNDALLEQLDRIIENTHGFSKIVKHVMDLHDVLKVDDSHVAMSNSFDVFKIKVEAPSEPRVEEALEKIKHFEEKFKVILEKVQGKETYYIKGFAK
ncbi:MAG: hypothetical protein GQ570_09175 [Helicobacteraceae bacterium]|nr:hypothetical protein [Helicobacteraceae bacterium]